MVRTGRCTVALVRADTNPAFMEHPKDGKTYAEVEPEVEYFVRLLVEPGPRVRARILYTSMARIWITARILGPQKYLKATIAGCGRLMAFVL